MDTTPALCACDYPAEPDRHTDGEPVICATCGRQIRCELAFNRDCAPSEGATVIHVDYVVCARHEADAIDAVASREW